MTNEVLLIPDKADIERDSIADSWKNNGGEIKRIGKFWEQPSIDPKKRVTIYGLDTFSLVLAQVLGIKLIEPKDELISKLDFKWIKRGIEILKIAEIDKSLFPIFLKPVKLDMAIYEGNSNLNSAREFLTDFLQNHSIDLPKSYVIDLGFNQTNGWYVIEFNSSWGAGLNSCDPDKVIVGIREATIN